MAEEQTPSPRKKRRRGPRRTRRKGASGKPGSSNGKLARAERIFHLLEALHREVDKDCGKSVSKSPIPLQYTPGGDAALFAHELLEAMLSSRRSIGDESTFVEGRVYCHHCDATACDHAAPPDHLHVFAGYTPTGFPVWEEFFSVLLTTRDPRIDDLLQENPGIVALFQGRNELNAEQLKIFGKESALYDILGQVVTGYLPLPRGNHDGKTAITVQAVRCKDKSAPGLRLNLIGRLPGGSDLIDHLKTDPEPELEGFFAAARKKLESLDRKRRAPAGRRKPGIGHEAVQPVLTRLARGIERTFRRRRRRTRHAMDRRSERPAVGMALKDLAKAAADRLLFDELHHTFIVVGPKWRVHVFGGDGRHVTSMTLNRESVQKRIDTRRWRYTSKEEVSSLRKEVRGRTQGERQS